jgi:hypothetical protein
MENRLERYVNGMKNIAREQQDSRDSAFFIYHTTRALANFAQNDVPKGLENVMEFLMDHLRMFEPPASRESGTDVDNYIAKKRCREEARREPDDGDVEDELEYMDEEGPDAVEAVRNLEDEPVSDWMLVDDEMDDSGWPGEYHMAPVPNRRSHRCIDHRRIDLPSDEAPVAGPSGLSSAEKEKENTPGMEVEDVAGPSGNPAENVKPAEVPVKVEEKEDENRVQYEIVEVIPTEPVVEETLAATVGGGEAVVEPKLEPVDR